MAPVIPLELRISYRCTMISSRIARFLAPMWQSRYGLSTDAWRILAIIGRYGPISAKEVATRTSSDAFHVSRAIERLARKKLIKLAETRRRGAVFAITPLAQPPRRRGHDRLWHQSTAQQPRSGR